jgi:hypothetical protein
MLPNVVFDKTAFVKFKISNNLTQTLMKQIQNNQKSIRKIHASLWTLKISRIKSANQKSRDFFQIFVISNNKKTIG